MDSGPRSPGLCTSGFSGPVIWRAPTEPLPTRDRAWSTSGQVPGSSALKSTQSILSQISPNHMEGRNIVRPTQASQTAADGVQVDELDRLAAGVVREREFHGRALFDAQHEARRLAVERRSVKVAPARRCG